MGIGTSKGAFYEDQFHYSQSQWDHKYDDNVVNPNKNGPESSTQDKNIVSPNQMRNNQQMQQFDLSIDNPEGGIDISNHTGFRKSDNIEDRSAEKGFTPGRGPLVDKFEELTGMDPEELFEFPAGGKAWNSLSKDAGYEDIKVNTQKDPVSDLDLENQRDQSDVFKRTNPDKSDYEGSIGEIFDNLSKVK